MLEGRADSQRHLVRLQEGADGNPSQNSRRTGAEPGTWDEVSLTMLQRLGNAWLGNGSAERDPGHSKNNAPLQNVTMPSIQTKVTCFMSIVLFAFWFKQSIRIIYKPLEVFHKKKLWFWQEYSTFLKYASASFNTC